MIPRSTYRFQVTADFDLREVAAVTDYVQRLGVDWLYLSPLLAAHEGSEHGYDVVDHRVVDPARGGGAALDGLARAYERWIGEAEDLVTAYPDPADEEAFAVRSRLVHEWRKFLFRDPGLPATLLPDDWPGARAGRFFDEEAARLLPAASRFVDRCLDGR